MTMTYDDRRIMPDLPQAHPGQFWDNRYREQDWAYGCEPNDFLRQQAPLLPQGDAICLAEGQGRNGIFLAELGHHVTLQDLSSVGLERAQTLAAAKNVQVHCLCCDLADF